jgi:hypothetical protein
MNRLLPGRKIKDAEPPHTEVDLAVSIKAVLIRATMDNLLRHVFQRHFIRLPGKSANSTHN